MTPRQSVKLLASRGQYRLLNRRAVVAAAAPGRVSHWSNEDPRAWHLMDDHAGTQLTDVEEEEEQDGSGDVGGLEDGTPSGSSEVPDTPDHLEDRDDQESNDGGRVSARVLVLVDLEDLDDVDDHLLVSMVERLGCTTR
jgi:hypothetical protein